MEAQGEVRGGRYVEWISGEQFALSGALGKLRKIRKSEKIGKLNKLSSADPLNLTGIILSEERVSISAHTQIIFRDGSVVAVQNQKNYDL